MKERSSRTKHRRQLQLWQRSDTENNSEAAEDLGPGSSELCRRPPPAGGASPANELLLLSRNQTPSEIQSEHKIRKGTKNRTSEVGGIKMLFNLKLQQMLKVPLGLLLGDPELCQQRRVFPPRPQGGSGETDW